MDVEEVKRKEDRLKRGLKKDLEFTSAHIKFGRRIMQALKRLRDEK